MLITHLHMCLLNSLPACARLRTLNLIHVVVDDHRFARLFAHAFNTEEIEAFIERVYYFVDHCPRHLEIFLVASSYFERLYVYSDLAERVHVIHEELCEGAHHWHKDLSAIIVDLNLRELS